MSYRDTLGFQRAVLGWLRANGWDARRAPAATAPTGDVSGLPGVRMSVSARRKLDPGRILGDAERSAESTDTDGRMIPVGVAARMESPAGDSFAVLRLSDFAQLLALAFPENVSPRPLPAEPLEPKRTVQCAYCGITFEPSGRQEFCSRRIETGSGTGNVE